MERGASRLLEAVASATASALREAETTLPADVLGAIEGALERERNPIARTQIENILENVRYAGEHALPICQDTGVPVVYLTLPPTVPFTPDLREAVAEGVRRATAAVPLRPNVVDPLITALEDEYDFFRWVIYGSLFRIGSRRAMTFLNEHLADDDLLLSGTSQVWLLLGDGATIKRLLNVLLSDQEQASHSAAETLKELGSKLTDF